MGAVRLFVAYLPNVWEAAVHPGTDPCEDGLQDVGHVVVGDEHHLPLDGLGFRD